MGSGSSVVIGLGGQLYLSPQADQFSNLEIRKIDSEEWQDSLAYSEANSTDHGDLIGKKLR